ncbi:site-specific integrase [Sphingomonas sp. BT-65]|uniref:tyrosine-type recombinase/integrase n=1 Tax=Sphingomonas sp. BT-65 TaxID=2989821 RepID=UPI0022361D61|nr:site-specific integrase [Sphingomonas sp. BT-65]MCW4460831.1 site-specific integrase [Sphingomonas sp. BT-65]
MANEKISKRVVDAAEPAAQGDTFLWDTELKGFGLRITPRAVKSYVIQYRIDGGPARRTTIGIHGSPWTPATAREFAEGFLFKVKQGVDPIEEKREAKKQAELLAFDGYADRFVELYLKVHWVDSWEDGESVMNAAKPHFENKPITALKRKDVTELLDSYSDRPGQKKLVHSVLRKFFNWAVDEGDLEASPIAGMKGPKPVPARKRVLNREELICAWLAAADLADVWRGCFRLLILTLQRREEVAAVDWREIELDAAMWELPDERAKNDEAHRVHLSALAIAELECFGPKRKGLVFTTTGTTAVSGFSKAKKALDARMLEIMRERAEKRGEDPDEVEFAPWRLHDLRRTGATNMQALGVPVEVTEAVLNHISGTRAGVAGVYNRYRYDPEKRKALDIWALHLGNLIEGREPTTNVIPFARYA